MAVRYFLPSAVAVSCPTCLLPLFVRPSVHQRQKGLGERERESDGYGQTLAARIYIYQIVRVPPPALLTTTIAPFVDSGSFASFFTRSVAESLWFLSMRDDIINLNMRSGRGGGGGGSFRWCMCPAVIASVVRSMALLFVRKNDFFLCSFKQEKKTLFFSSLFFLPLIFGFPCCVRPCWPHHQTIRRVWKLSSTDLQINTQQPLLALWWFFVVVVCLSRRFPKVGIQNAMPISFLSIAKVSLFLLFFFSLVFTFPIFSYHFDDMSKTNSGQPPPHSARVCCIKWRCLSLISFPRTQRHDRSNSWEAYDANLR